MSNLPKGWIEVPLLEFIKYLSTGVPTYSGEKEYYSTGSIQESQYDPEGKFTFNDRPSRANRISKIGDVFQARMKGTDKGLLIEEKLNDKLFSTGFIQLRPYENTYESKLLYYFVKSKIFIDQKDELATGSTQEALTDSKAIELTLIVPPLNEQKRIVEKLDKLLARVEEAKARLEKIPVIIKRFRQSVLNAAVTGELTKELKLEAWDNAKLKTLAIVLDPQPSHRTPPIELDGIPYIGMGDIDDRGVIDFSNARKVGINVLSEHKRRYQLNEGDFIFGKIGTIGKPVKIPVKQDYTLSANVILIKPNGDLINSNFLFYYLSSSILIEAVNLETKATSQPAYGIKKMRECSIPVPSIGEQKEIVKRVEALFKKADEIEERYKKAKVFVDKLTQSILAKAFRGELVPQDPNDEPADKLLERIKAEKEKQITEKGKKKQDKEKVVKEIIKKHHKAMKKLN